MGGRKYALLVGCNYPNKIYELQGCYIDVNRIQSTLITKLGFEPRSVEVLTDVIGSTKKPTGATIKDCLSRMVAQSRRGDVIVFHFSGHGTTLPSNSKMEAIIPSDLNLITSIDFRNIVDRVPKGVTFTILADSCNSGGLIDKEPEQIGPHRQPRQPTTTKGKPKRIPYQSLLQHLSSLSGLNSPNVGVHLLKLFGRNASLSFQQLPPAHPLGPDQGILLSGCQADEYSYDTSGGQPGGTFTTALVTILNKNSAVGLSNRKIVVMARQIVDADPQVHGLQHPCLYCSNKNADAPFLVTI